MSGKKRDSGLDERLDRLGRELIRASASDEAEAVAASPFLYTRLRSRINAERVRREEGESWLTMLRVFWRAVPAMALVAVCALALFWSAATNTLTAGNFSVNTLLNAPDTGIERTVFADDQSLSSDEVLATIMNNDGEAAK